MPTDDQLFNEQFIVPGTVKAANNTTVNNFSLHKMPFHKPASPATSSATTLTGDTSANLLIGGTGNDSLFGSAGNDSLWGGAGNDTLTGGSGDDLLCGASGDDTYWFDTLWGNDTIAAFPSSGQDVISFGAGITAQTLTVSQTSTNVLITAGEYSGITLQNWNSTQLNSILFSDGSTVTISSLLNAGTTTSTTATEAASSGDHALIIGIGDYPGFSSDLAGVSYDLSDVQTFLTSDTVWAGSSTDILTNQQATKSGLSSELTQLAAEASTGDDVLIYYSGHGYSDGGLSLYDNTEYDVATLYQSITAIGEKVGASGHVSVILDSCYSGSLVDYFNTHTSDSRYSVLTACSSSQSSYDSPTNGIFTHYLFDNALTGKAADANGDAAITVQEAYQYLTTSAYSRYATVQLYGSGSYVIA